jgi:hypothetical protein
MYEEPAARAPAVPTLRLSTISGPVPAIDSNAGEIVLYLGPDLYAVVKDRKVKLMRNPKNDSNLRAAAANTRTAKSNQGRLQSELAKKEEELAEAKAALQEEQKKPRGFRRTAANAEWDLKFKAAMAEKYKQKPSKAEPEEAEKPNAEMNELAEQMGKMTVWKNSRSEEKRQAAKAKGEAQMAELAAKQAKEKSLQETVRSLEDEIATLKGKMKNAEQREKNAQATIKRVQNTQRQRNLKGKMQEQLVRKVKEAKAKQFTRNIQRKRNELRVKASKRLQEKLAGKRALELLKKAMKEKKTKVEIRNAVLEKLKKTMAAQKVLAAMRKTLAEKRAKNERATSPKEEKEEELNNSEFHTPRSGSIGSANSENQTVGEEDKAEEDELSNRLLSELPAGEADLVPDGEIPLVQGSQYLNLLTALTRLLRAVRESGATGVEGFTEQAQVLINAAADYLERSGAATAGVIRQLRTYASGSASNLSAGAQVAIDSIIRFVKVNVPTREVFMTLFGAIYELVYLGGARGMEAFRNAALFAGRALGDAGVRASEIAFPAVAALGDAALSVAMPVVDGAVYLGQGALSGAGAVVLVTLRTGADLASAAYEHGSVAAVRVGNAALDGAGVLATAMAEFAAEHGSALRDTLIEVAGRMLEGLQDGLVVAGEALEAAAAATGTAATGAGRALGRETLRIGSDMLGALQQHGTEAAIFIAHAIRTGSIESVKAALYILKKLLEGLATLGNWLVEHGIAAGNGLLEIVAEYAPIIGNALLDLTKALLNFSVSVISGVGRAVYGALPSRETVGGVLGSAVEGAVGIVGTVVAGIVEYGISAPASYLWGLLPGGNEEVGGVHYSPLPLPPRGIAHGISDRELARRQGVRAASPNPPPNPPPSGAMGPSNLRQRRGPEARLLGEAGLRVHYGMNPGNVYRPEHPFGGGGTRRKRQGSYRRRR